MFNAHLLQYEVSFSLLQENSKFWNVLLINLEQLIPYVFPILVNG